MSVYPQGCRQRAVSDLWGLANLLGEMLSFQVVFMKKKGPVFGAGAVDILGAF